MIHETIEKIKTLPVGYITKKKINGTIYHYHQWEVDGKTKSRIVKGEELENLKEQIEERKILQKELKRLQKEELLAAQPAGLLPQMELATNALYGTALKDMVRMADGLDKRKCYAIIEQYIYGQQMDKVCLVYGLRRTGKTTLIRQLIREMNQEDFERSIYIKATQLDTMADLNKDMKKLCRMGYKYVFIDEVTLIRDFIDSAALFSDVYAAQGMKIVLSGTDSLGFYIAANEELYDRAVMVHTTFIPYGEHCRLLKISSVDEYIRYGGTLKAGELDFEDEDVNAEDASFRDDESTRRYIDTAICKNIQHSLACYEDGGHFRHLKKLYEQHELTNAINRIIQNMNHEFTAAVITRKFKSRDLRSAAQLLRNAREESMRTEALDEMDMSSVLERLMNILEIYNEEEQKVKVTDVYAAEIKEYLKALDLIEYSEVETTVATSERVEHVIFTQPGMRFCQAQALVYSLMKDEQFWNRSERERKLISDKILQDVRGVMLEDIVLLETMKAMPAHKRAFKLLFDVGEFDMVIYDQSCNECEIYEIKHSNVQDEYQWKNMMQESKLLQTEKRFGRIVKKCVLYTGKTEEVGEGCLYKNVEEYLMEFM